MTQESDTSSIDASSLLAEAAAGEATAVLLGNGRYAVLLTRTGAGFSSFDGRALTRWIPDAVRQLHGTFLYLRDLDTGECWSAGYEPLAGTPLRYEVHAGDGRVIITRQDGDIETRLEVCVSPDADVELRRLTITNHGDRTRRIDVTSYLEVVLNDLRGDAAHPVFSKLFVQTEYIPDGATLLAWRRLRAPDDRPLWLAHRLIGAGAVTFETDRLQFLGRGRSTAEPRALDAAVPLSGTAGNVLDPVFCMRRVLSLEPQQSASLTAVLAAAITREQCLELVQRYDSESAVAGAFAAALVAHGTNGDAVMLTLPDHATLLTASTNWRALGMPESWLRSLLFVGTPLLHGETAQPAFHPVSRAAAAPSRRDRAELQFFNGIGGFSSDGMEYVLHLDPSQPQQRPPLPWTNVIANEHAGFLISESGGGYSWAGNSRRFRLTPWSNDPVSDPVGEAIYIRDNAARAFWSATPAPAPAPGGCVVRHGIGYSTFEQYVHGIEQQLTVFVPRNEPVKLALLTLRNDTDRERDLTVFAYARWVLGAKAQETAPDIVTHYDAAQAILFASNRVPPVGHGVAFAAVSHSCEDVRVSADRAAFLGPFGTLAAPAAVTSGASLDGRIGERLDPCAAFEVPLTVAPQSTVSLVFLLGHAADEQTAAAYVAQFREPGDALQALDDVRLFWQELVGRVRVSTPTPAIDLMVNGWLAYQTLSCRIWGRSAFYQSGGAFGFRDQLQDAASLILLAPELTRAQILLHAAHQFVEGDVLHWWHPPDSLGIRTRFADDLLWLPYITAYYSRVTGDYTVLDEPARFVTGRAVPPAEDEILLTPDDAHESAPVYEHCCRALDRSLTTGAHGLPLIGTGDWNDGMNRVGRLGRGESVWLGFFLYDILDDFIPLCEQRGDTLRAARYRTYQRELAAALETGGWDGDWYRRAYYDDGTPIGSATSDECRIDAIAQAWAVISGAAPTDRAERALDALEQHLVSEQDRLIRLLTPPFDRTPHDPGYIKGYLPGVRENGGQYTHGALWAVRALAEAGRVDRAAPLLEMLSPVTHGATAADVATYRAEPYVIAADVYGEAPHVGRAGWSWYTGSSGWMLRVALESVLGFELLAGRTIRLQPRIPRDWPGYSLEYRVPGSDTHYVIDVQRTAGSSGITGMLDNDVALQVEDGAVLIPVAADGRTHTVRVQLSAV